MYNTLYLLKNARKENSIKNVILPLVIGPIDFLIGEQSKYIKQ